MLPSSSLLSDCHSATAEARLEALGDQIAELSAHIHAATFRLLLLIREFDSRDGWAVGFRTCAHWLSWRTGINLGAAREKVRVARALEHLPRLSGGLERGELSYTKVRALTRVATPANDAELLELGQNATAAQIEHLVRAWRRADRAEERSAERLRHDSRFLTLWPDSDGMWMVRGRLDPEVGAVLLRALEAAGDALFRQDASGDSVEDVDPRVERAPTYGQRLADAVGLIAERALEIGFGDEDAPDASAREAPTRRLHRADRFQVVLHVESQDLEAEADPGGGELEDGIRVSAETSRRLSCDASRVVMRDDPSGGVLDVGRRTRTIPPAIRRALDHRDGGCRFPGCGVRFTDAHHIRHWADGGETRLDNLVLLCRKHHRAVHEEGVRVEMLDGQPRFHAQSGRILPQVPNLPALEDGLSVLLARHTEAGLTMDPWTCSSGWEGEHFDIGFALDGLQEPRD